MIPAPTWKPSNAEYHGTVEAVSSSMLKTFRGAPALYYQTYIEKSVEREKPTASMVIGSAVNVLLLEPERADRYVYVAGVKARTAKEYKEAYKLRPDQLVLTETEWEEAQLVAASILEPKTQAARIARELLRNDDGFSEYAYCWTEPSGLLCKSMVDRLRMIQMLPTIVELKTTVDPSPEAFQAHFWRMQYHCQAAFNLRGARRLLGEAGSLLRFLVVAVRNEAPYDVFVYQPDEGLLKKGADQVEEDLAGLARCHLHGSPWQTPAENITGNLPSLSAPAWAYNKPASGVFNP
jgi:hypothetical protein